MVAQDSSQSDSVEQVISELQRGDRHPVADADGVDGVDGLQAVKATHETSEGPVVLHYNHCTAYRPTDDGLEEFNIYDEGLIEIQGQGE